MTVQPGLKPAIARLARGERLSEAEAEAAFEIIMAGGATAAQIGAILMMLRLRGETVAEMTGAVRAMLARMVRVAAPPGAIDVCGTGGDGRGTLNVSTAVTLVVASLGVAVAKHGNRAASSLTGGADVLAALGVDVEVALDRLPDVFAAAGCAFLFAPRHHGALRHAAEARRDLGTPTLFNILGPLANPARVRRQLTGVFDPAWSRPMAEALQRLGSEKAWLVHGQGLDELTVAGVNEVVELDHGVIRSFTIDPAEAGLASAPIEALRGGEAATNAATLLALLQGQRGAYRDTVLLNAAAALIVADRTGDLKEGVMLASRAIDEGDALRTLDRMRLATAVAA